MKQQSESSMETSNINYTNGQKKKKKGVEQQQQRLTDDDIRDI